MPSLPDPSIRRERAAAAAAGGLRLPYAGSLYRPSEERDACGVGMVASIHGRPTHDTLLRALEALHSLEHRGAVASDGRSGDGAGVLTQLPRDLFAYEVADRKLELSRIEDLAVGVFFVAPPAPANLREIREEIVGIVADSGPRFLGWREVPVEPSVLGEQAARARPTVMQALMARPRGMSDGGFERLLYLTRRRIERRATDAGWPLYVPSFSHRTIVYKGLMVAGQLHGFYRDLADEHYTTAIAVFHQRYSTNTFPSWQLAQPYRFLAHNGEINTLAGNVNRIQARQLGGAGGRMVSQLQVRDQGGEDLDDLGPVIQPGGSDSATLDNVFELVANSRRDVLHAMMMMVPEAYHKYAATNPDLFAFYTYHATLMAPWDGPAALCFTDGRYAAASLDRNGLRPLRYWITDDDNVVVGSEAGMVRFDDHHVVRRGRLGPGEMLAVDTRRGRLIHNGEIKRFYARRRPYRAWVESQVIEPFAREPANAAAVADPGPELSDEQFVRLQKAFGYSQEDLKLILEPMATDAKVPVGSMGDDTPIAVFSRQPQLLYRYFKQRFAQVTNPPIDPIRERNVMSLNTAVGNRGSLLMEEEDEDQARLVKFPSPIVGHDEFRWLAALDQEGLVVRKLSTLTPVDGGVDLQAALDRLAADALELVRAGCSILILSDRGVREGRLAVPMLLAMSAVHRELMQHTRRLNVSIVCETGEAREDHHFACLIGYSAALVYPYMALETVHRIALESGDGLDPATAMANYREAAGMGLLKIMSKMGISSVSSYRSAQVFEALGVSREVVDRYFTGTASKIDGIGLPEIAADALAWHRKAFAEDAKLDKLGIYTHSKAGEFHAINPPMVRTLHKAVRNGSQEDFDKYVELVQTGPVCNIRDLFRFEPAGGPAPLEEVEPEEEILRRFCTQAMSHGALSREAHEVLAVAMNRIGGKSNSGEGGEAAERLKVYEADPTPIVDGGWFPHRGDRGTSRIKQIASGRFGVTPEYLVSADELEIKMAQGAKPGEGGQIPGFKVTPEIAAIRRSTPGVTLISPPPHHDIYSIEDLSQLIYDLKRINPGAAVCVKLVSEAGVGTIAAGVAKGYADVIMVSGHDGGTGASPLSSIKHAGMPWELGLAETQQVLCMNGLRGRVRLRVDGGLRTGRDVVVAAILGAEEFGFGTAAVIASGCVMARICHTNKCPVGVASQDPKLRAKFPGTPEHVVAFMVFVARQVRMLLASLGVRRLEDLVGRTELLRQRDDTGLAKTEAIDLSAVLFRPPTDVLRSGQPRNDRPEAETTLDDRILADGCEALDLGEPLRKRYQVRNKDRSVGARLSGEIARRRGDDPLPDGFLTLRFHGSAGQSFGVFCNSGMTLHLEGEAQDYVGKGMHGGRIVVRFPQRVPLSFRSQDNCIVGNTVLYGATGGELLAAGQAGERLAVRNSGATVVVEGCGDHGCEYMTGGVAVVLGRTGTNFGAGMSGGVAYVLDVDGRFADRLNGQMVQVVACDSSDLSRVRTLVARHVEHTGSAYAADLLERWDDAAAQLRRVEPTDKPAVLPTIPQEGDVSVQGRMGESVEVVSP